MSRQMIAKYIAKTLVCVSSRHVKTILSKKAIVIVKTKKTVEERAKVKVIIQL